MTRRMRDLQRAIRRYDARVRKLAWWERCCQGAFDRYHAEQMQSPTYAATYEAERKRLAK